MYAKFIYLNVDFFSGLKATISHNVDYIRPIQVWMIQKGADEFFCLHQKQRQIYKGGLTKLIGDPLSSDLLMTFQVQPAVTILSVVNTQLQANNK